MKKNIFRSLFRVVPVVMLGMSTISCEKTFDLKPEDTLDREQMYQNQFDADVAVIGVYGKFLNLSEQYVVLNELRADLINLTANAASNGDLLAVNYHTVEPQSDNKYADPKPFYEVIVACNDVMKNLNIMLEENKLPAAEYNQRYSDIAGLRSWVYLQLGIHFNEIPYITDPMETVNDLKVALDASSVTYLRLDDGSLLDTLINFTNSLPTLGNYAEGSSLIIPNIDQFRTDKFFINKNFLLGDLYLWKGEYTKAATHYKAVMETVTDGNEVFDRYKVRWAGAAQSFDPRTNFSGIQNQGWMNEWIWELPFSPNFEPENPFIDLFSNIGGSYLLKPSEEAIEHWELETRTDPLLQDQSDPRGTAAVRTFLAKPGEPLVAKYLYSFNTALPYQKPGNLFLYRAALLHLRYAEAANRDGKHKVAFALLNHGLNTTFDPTPGRDPNEDVTNIQQTKEPFPYDLDARQGDFPFFRGAYHRNTGIRGRAGLPAIDLTFSSDSLGDIEDALIHEAALELAFEGNRWPDLLRVAMRRNDPSFLADAVYEKFEQANDPRAAEVRTRLMNRANWFLPFRWE